MQSSRLLVLHRLKEVPYIREDRIGTKAQLDDHLSEVHLAGVDPGVGPALLETAERLAEGQVGHDVERGEVEEPHGIEDGAAGGTTGRAGDVPADQVDQLPRVERQHRVQLRDGAVAEGIAEDLAEALVLCAVRRVDGVAAVGEEILAVLLLLGVGLARCRRVSVDVFPGLGRCVAEAVGLDANHVAVLVMKSVHPPDRIARDKIVKVNPPSHGR